MSSSVYIVGIDLGTTNCALAFAEPARGAAAPVTDFAIPQLHRPGQVVTNPLLPSCLYLPGEHELPAGSTCLPWEVPGSCSNDSPAMNPAVPAGEPPALPCGSGAESAGLIAGEFARWQGARVPGRLVASAKSWLCHAGVDRTAPILPWGAPAEVTKISPVDASARLLGHLAAAWNHAHPDAPLADQEVVITVPASFDEVARALTVTAAQRAGLQKFTLVEEPQAAFYAFTARHREDLARALGDARLVLVVDVGGGTTDFTLIQVAVSPEGPVLQRLAVGEHLMLGGDNMDAALARLAEERMLPGGRRLSAAQWTQLLQTTRTAKESLLGREAPARHGLALAGEGSRLLGATLSTELQREETERLILEGFFPACGPGDAPQRASRVALQELGLPYAQDPAITRHLAGFLRQHAAAGCAALADGAGAAQEGLPRPDAILLNGGVFNSPPLAERLLAVVCAWWPAAPPIRLLAHDSLELAVARGAAGYGLVRRGLGRRITGGAAHAFYVGLAGETATAATRAVCLIPRGHEEGQTVELTAQPFALTLGRAVQFPLFTTTADRVDRPGTVVEIGDDLRALPPIHTLFKPADCRAITVPVHLRATLTELGTLELWCVANRGDERWRLEFELRGGTVGAAPAVT
jgi:molecular chaperone DnaK (HSP70)